MNDCLNAEMRDSLPDLIHGNLEPAKVAQIEAHIASCDECAAEVELLRNVVASRPAAPPINVQRILAALPVAAKQGLLLHRGNGEPASAARPAVRRPKTIWSHPALRIAAAIAVVSAGALSMLVGREVTNPEVQVGRNAPRVAPVTAPPSAPTSTTPLATRVAQQVEPSSPSVPATTLGAGLLISEIQQLSDEHLVALLSEMDDIDAVPSSEPEAITPEFAGLDTIGSSE